MKKGAISQSDFKKMFVLLVIALLRTELPLGLTFCDTYAPEMIQEYRGQSNVCPLQCDR
jgi:hypothetical protein